MWQRMHVAEWRAAPLESSPARVSDYPVITMEPEMKQAAA